MTITFPADLTAETRTLSGWGRTNPVTAQVVQLQILRVIVSAGFFIPVTPGTCNDTVGGAIAANVRDKNHHR